MLEKIRHEIRAFRARGIAPNLIIQYPGFKAGCWITPDIDLDDLEIDVEGLETYRVSEDAVGFDE